MHHRVLMSWLLATATIFECQTARAETSPDSIASVQPVAEHASGIQCTISPSCSTSSCIRARTFKASTKTVQDVCAASNQIQVLALGSPMSKASELGGGASNNDNLKTWLDFISKIAWPVVVFIWIWLKWDNLFEWFSKRLKRFKKGDFEVEFTPEAAEKVKESIEELIKNFSAATDIAYRRQAAEHDILGYLRDADKIIRTQLRTRYQEDPASSTRTDEALSNMRLTIHVPDIIYTGHLYQLLDYIPSRNGAGRRFSQRRGILGRAWRLEKSLGAGNALAETSNIRQLLDNNEDKASALVSEWAMTYDEARRWHERPRPAFLCIMLRVPNAVIAEKRSRETGRTVGVLYVDSLTVDAFGSDDEALKLAKELEALLEDQQLPAEVEALMRELRKSHVNIEIENG